MIENDRLRHLIAELEQLIGHQPFRQPRGAGGAGGGTALRRAIIVGAVSIGTNRWHYDGDEIGSLDVDSYVPLAGGMQWREADGTYLLNDVEASNNGVGIEGHGVDVTSPDYPTNFSVQPIGIGAVVWVMSIKDENNPQVQRWTICAPNTDFGSCT